MLSLPNAPFKAGGENYYTNLAAEDYYLRGGEPMGQWFGTGAEKLGLSGTVERQGLSRLVCGLSPDGQSPLVRNAHDPERAAGWDLTFSAPKSVSVLWSQADPETRAKIQDCHRQAVESTLSFIEDEFAYSRVGKGGYELSKAHFAFALFEHGTSRAQDPLLHTHSLLFNACVREDGSTGTIYSAPIYRAKMLLGLHYRVQFAHLLEQNLGLRTVAKGRGFALVGIAQSVIDHFSKRRQTIKTVLKERGLESARAAAAVTLETREKKAHIPRATLIAAWQEAGRRVGFGPEAAQALLASAREGLVSKVRHALGPLPNRVARHLAESQGQFTEHQLLRFTLQIAQGTGRGVEEVKARVASCLKSVVAVGQNERGQALYTTPSMFAAEEKILRLAEKSRAKPMRFGSNLIYGIAVCAWEKLPFAKKLSDEQRGAVRHLTLSPGRVKLMAGGAGTGKSFTLRAARRVFELQNYRVLGAAVSGVAAENLQKSSGIRSRTVASLLLAHKKGRLRFDRNTILVVDEAAMVGNRDLLRLVELTQKNGARLILVGDEKQIQPIEAGGAFKALSQKLGRAELKEVRRQEQAWAKEMVKDFARGDAEGGLKRLDDHGQLHFADTKNQALKQLITDWKDKALFRPQGTIILASTNQDVQQLNEQAQKERQEARCLGKQSVRYGNYQIHRGDRVVFTRNSKLLNVKNGYLGTVLGVTKAGITVKLDGGLIRTVPVFYRDLKLGYALTAHKAQGATVQNALVFAGEKMQEREISYVEVSRAKHHTSVYAVKATRDDSLKSLARQMNKSGTKHFAQTHSSDQKEESAHSYR